MITWFKSILLTIFLVLTVLVGYLFIPNIEFQSSLKHWFLQDDPEVIVYDNFLKEFESDDLILVAATNQNSTWSKRDLQWIKRVTEELKMEKGFLQVYSWSNLVDFYKHDDQILLKKLNAKTWEELQVFLKKPQFNELISKDQKSALFILQTSPRAQDYNEQKRLVNVVKQALTDSPDHIQSRITGPPVISQKFHEMTQKNTVWFTILLSAALFVVLFLCLKDIKATLALMLLSASSLCFTLAVVVWQGVQIDILTSGILIVVLTLSFSNMIHLYFERAQTESVFKTIQNLLWPCFLTTLTTMLGLLVLQWSSIRSVKEFGLMSALGVMISFLVSFLIFPIVMNLLDLKANTTLFKMIWYQKLLNRIQQSKTFARRIVYGVSILAAVGLFFATQIPTSANLLKFFPENSDLYQNHLFVDQNLSGTGAIEWIIPSQEWTEPHLWDQLKQFKTTLKSDPSLSSIQSLDNLMLQLDEHSLKTKESIQDHLFMLQNFDEFNQWMTSDYQTLRLTTRIKLTEADNFIFSLSDYESKFHKTFGKEAQVTGFLKLISKLQTHILESFYQTILLSLSLTLLIFLIAFRNIKSLWIGLSANLIPLTIGLGVLFLFGGTLNPATVMISSLTLGLIVDDTIHLLHHLKKSTVSDVSKRIIYLSKPLFVTSLVLSVGFLVFLSSDFLPHLSFGLIASLVIALAWIIDLIWVPAIIFLKKN